MARQGKEHEVLEGVTNQDIRPMWLQHNSFIRFNDIECAGACLITKHEQLS